MSRFLLKYLIIFIVLMAGAMVLPLLVGTNEIAFAESEGLQIENDLGTDLGIDLNNDLGSTPKVDVNTIYELPDQDELEEEQPDENYTVQAVLTSKQEVVISGTIDGVLEKLPFHNGDAFKKGDVLVQYNCRLEKARIKEIEARLRISTRQLQAYKRLKDLDAVADIEYISTQEQSMQDRALLDQAKARADLCVIKAPFDGRVKEKIASNYEAVKSGRVLMEISSKEPLQAELLVPSVWLRWLNIDTKLQIYIHESDRIYGAKVVRIHGQVDPVTQTAHVVAEIDGYQEELLPGMSGSAEFFPGSDEQSGPGFLGLSIGGQGGEGN